MREAGHSGTRARLRTEFFVSLAILTFVAVLPAVIMNEYWRGVVIVSMYFAILAAAGISSRATQDNSPWRRRPLP